MFLPLVLWFNYGSVRKRNEGEAADESWRQAGREPGAQEVGATPNAVAKSKVATQRVTVRSDQEVSQSGSDVSGSDAFD